MADLDMVGYSVDCGCGHGTIFIPQAMLSREARDEFVKYDRLVSLAEVVRRFALDHNGPFTFCNMFMRPR